MNSLIGSNLLGARLIAATTCFVLLLGSSITYGQDTPQSGVSDEVLNLMLEMTTQRPASQATAAERSAARDELENISAISDLPSVQALADGPKLKAQLDLQRRALLFNAFATDFVANNQPTEQEIFNTYQEHVGLAAGEEYKARHILVETQGAAVSLIEELQSGASFEELAAEHSTGPSSTSGGDLGWFPANAMVEQFSDAVVLLENGEYTKTPVQTQFGWHVILREDSRQSTPPPLDSVRDAIVQRISQEKFLEYLGDLRTKVAEQRRLNLID